MPELASATIARAAAPTPRRIVRRGPVKIRITHSESAIAPTNPTWNAHRMFSLPAPRKVIKRPRAVATRASAPARIEMRQTKWATPRWAMITGMANGRK